MGAEPLLRVGGLTVRYPGGAGLEGVELGLHAGEALAVVGASGSGKSTLAAALLGLFEPPAELAGGRVELAGRELTRLPRAELDRVRGREIGLVFQEPLGALNPVLTIGAQVAEGLRLHAGLDRRAARAAAVRALGEVGLPDPEGAAASFPHQLSGGMRQRALVAIALAPRPRVLVADEPLTALDATVREDLLARFERERRERGMALVLVSHDLAAVARTADRVLVLERGRAVECRAPEELFADPRHPATRALVAAAELGAPGPGPVSNGGVGRAAGEVPVIASDRAGDRAESLREERARPLELVRPIPEPQLELVDLAVAHAPRRTLLGGARGRRTVQAVRGVSLGIGAGEVVGLVGESGCGKSSLARAVAGLLPFSGDVLLHDRAGTRRLGSKRNAGGPTAARRGPAVGLVFQDPQQSLNPRHRVERIVGEALLVHGLASREAIAARVGDWLERVGLERSAAARYPHAFSGGERQRIALARALAIEPCVLVLDEPTSSLDAPLRAGVLALVRSLASELGLSVLLISHDLRAVRATADRVAVMYLGRLVEVGSTARVLGRGVHPYTRALLAADAGRLGPEVLLRGEPPSPLAPPSGCAFHPRCPLAASAGVRCAENEPPEVEDHGHRARCHLVEVKE